MGRGVVSDRTGMSTGKIGNSSKFIPKIKEDHYDPHAEHKARQMGRKIDWEDVKRDMEDLDTYFQRVFNSSWVAINSAENIDLYNIRDIALAREMLIKGMLINRNQFNGEDILEFIRAGR